MKEMIKVLKIEPLQKPVITELESTMKAFRSAVSIGTGKRCEVMSKKIDDGVFIIYNADFFKLSLYPNRLVGDEIINGTFYVLGVDTDSMPISLTVGQLRKYKDKYKKPEVWSDFDIMDHNLKVLEKSLNRLEVQY